LVQPILFFLLGFLCAVFLVALIAPAYRRRAVTLTRRRIESALPLTLAEIQADKDRLRAEHAMSVRKLEMDVKALREKAAGQVVEIANVRKALTNLEAKHEGQGREFAELAARHAAITEELQKREAQLQAMSQKYAATEKTADARLLELERLGQMYDEASISASSRQIELVARETEMEKLAGELSASRAEKKALVRQRQEMEAQARLADNTLNAEKKKAVDLEKKLQRMMTTLADREDKLDRREKEIARLRQITKVPAAAGSRGSDIDKAIAKLDADRVRLEEKLTALANENKALRREVSSRKPPRTNGGDEGLPGVAALREQMHELAAEVVNLTARLDEPDSPIAQALATLPEDKRAGGKKASMVSLADRIRALQKAASAG